VSARVKDISRSATGRLRTGATPRVLCVAAADPRRKEQERGVILVSQRATEFGGIGVHPRWTGGAAILDIGVPAAIVECVILLYGVFS
jgi:hypothetical protein